jgi:hypothetical protein
MPAVAGGRMKRDNAKKLLAAGIDPFVERKAERRKARIARSHRFEAVPCELMERFEAEDDAPTTLKKKRWPLDFVDKEFGKRPKARLRRGRIDPKIFDPFA